MGGSSSKQTKKPDKPVEKTAAVSATPTAPAEEKSADKAESAPEASAPAEEKSTDGSVAAEEKSAEASAPPEEKSADTEEPALEASASAEEKSADASAPAKEKSADTGASASAGPEPAACISGPRSIKAEPASKLAQDESTEETKNESEPAPVVEVEEASAPAADELKIEDVAPEDEHHAADATEADSLSLTAIAREVEGKVDEKASDSAEISETPAEQKEYAAPTDEPVEAASDKITALRIQQTPSMEARHTEIRNGIPTPTAADVDNILDGDMTL